MNRSVEPAEVWLVAGGMRREGSQHDPYTVIERLADAGRLVTLLPERIDQVAAQLDAGRDEVVAWKVAAAATLIEAVAVAARDGHGEAVIPGPAGEAEAVTVTVTADPVLDKMDAGEEAILEVRLELDLSALGKHQLVAQALLVSILQPDLERWDVLPFGTSTELTVLVARAWIGALVVAGTAELSNLVSRGMASATHAHFTSKSGLAGAIVDGRAVTALCERSFVPMHDHTPLPVCDECDRRLRALQP